MIDNNRCPLKVLRMFLAEIKNVSKSKLLFDWDKIILSEEEKSQLESYITRYEANEPVSKILNRREFWTSEFFVNSDVLDPRPETELIVERSLKLFDKGESFDFLDIGTGSGCLLLSIAKEFPKSFGIGIDVNNKSVIVAKTNQKNLKVDNVEIRCVDWNKFNPQRKFDLIVSNPPYIKTDTIAELDDNVKNFDPIVALDGGATGLVAYEQLSDLILNWLKPNGKVLLEIGFDQFESVKTLFESKGFLFNQVLVDMQGIKRTLEFNR